jgi:hypothetical protein
MATVDHLYSRYDPRRWVKAKDGEVRKVLACFECNNKRASWETKNLGQEELSKRGQGHCLNKKGVLDNSCETLEEVYSRLEANGIEIMRVETLAEPFYSPEIEVLCES